MSIFGMNRVRVGIAAALRARGGTATTTELVDDLGVGHMTVVAHLRALEEAGAVIGDVPHDERSRGRQITWTYQEDVVRYEISTLIGELAPFPRPPRRTSTPPASK